MRYFVLLAALLMFGCGGDSGESTTTKEMKEPVEEMADEATNPVDEATDAIEKTAKDSMQKAEEVEVLLNEAKEDRDKAVEDASQ